MNKQDEPEQPQETQDLEPEKNPKGGTPGTSVPITGIPNPNVPITGSPDN
jgi:hypothetical protein